MENKSIYRTIAILSLICLIFAVLIYSEEAQYSQHQNNFCSALTGSNGCETVQTSSYGKIFGIDNSVYGIIGFTALGIFSLILSIQKQKKNKILEILTIAGGIIAGLTALTFLYIQAFILHTYCIFCLVVDTCSLMILGLTIYLLTKKGKHK